MADKTDITNLIVMQGGKKNPLEILQHNNAVSFIGGKAMNLDRNSIRDVKGGKPEAQVNFMKIPDAKIKMGRELEAASVSCSKPKGVIEEYFINPNTTVYNLQAFTPKPQPPDTLNLWSGHTVEPKKGDSEILNEFLKYVICDGNKELYEYLCGTIAHNLQKPEEKTGICIVLIGDEGVGKGIFFQLLDCIWRKTTLLVQDMDIVVGQFNKELEHHYNICLDEALFSGNKKQTDKLKSLITENSITIEGKYEPTRKMLSYHRFYAATNRPHFAHIRTDDRRFLFIRVSNIHKQDTEYFSKVVSALHDGHTLEAFVYEAMNYDLKDFNFRNKPYTEETLEQKIRSLNGVYRYWHEVLQHADFTVADDSYHTSTAWYEPNFITGKAIKARYEAYEKKANRYEGVQLTSVYKAIEEMCPSVKRHKPSSGNYKDKRGLKYPHIDIAREEFDIWIKGKIQWS
jgi:phage/plasmid-associated DNA primase